MRFAGAKRHWLAIAVLVSLMGVGLSWSSAAAHALSTTSGTCVRTTTISRPTGLTSTVNPSTREGKPVLENGILLQWDVPPADDEVIGYDLYKREARKGTKLEVFSYFSLEWAGQHHPITRMEFMDPELFPNKRNLVDGQSYIYRVVAVRLDNCYIDQESEQSLPHTVTWTAPAVEEDDQVGGL